MTEHKPVGLLRIALCLQAQAAWERLWRVVSAGTGAWELGRSVAALVDKRCSNEKGRVPWWEAAFGLG